MKLMFSLKEAAEATGLSTGVLKSAITQDYSSGGDKKVATRLPRLAAKRPTGSSGYRILATDLQAWLEQLPDA